MNPREFDNYKFSKSTMVLYRGIWSEITEVWFREGLIGIRETGGLVSYNEIESIKQKEDNVTNNDRTN